MSPWLEGDTQHIVGCPVDMAESKEGTQLQHPWAVDGWELRDCEEKCQILCHGLNFLPGHLPSAACLRLAAGLDRSWV